MSPAVYGTVIALAVRLSEDEITLDEARSVLGPLGPWLPALDAAVDSVVWGRADEVRKRAIVFETARVLGVEKPRLAVDYLEAARRARSAPDIFSLAGSIARAKAVVKGVAASGKDASA